MEPNEKGRRGLHRRFFFYPCFESTYLLKFACTEMGHMNQSEVESRFAAASRSIRATLYYAITGLGIGASVQRAEKGRNSRRNAEEPYSSCYGVVPVIGLG
jgi:hypothetical protein